MTKRALCVGINDYPIRDMDLKGCVNDAKAWAGLLVGHYDFAKPDVKVLLDRQATKVNIMRGLKDLLAGSRRGDVLMFQNSSHGTYVADSNGDERLYDEAICPWDTKDKLIVDDELRELFANLKPGVRLTVISDSCFSGSVTRALVTKMPTPDDRRVRFMTPRKIGLKAIKDVRHTAMPRSRFGEAAMKEVLLSGCRDNQYSFDAKFGRKHHGAMSFVALSIIAAANYRITYRALHSKLVPALENAMFDQEPQLEGRTPNLNRHLFT